MDETPDPATAGHDGHPAPAAARNPGSAVVAAAERTLALARTEADLAEAAQRLRRLARTFELGYLAAGPSAWDAPRGDEWTRREVAEHVATPWYAEQVGDLSRPRHQPN
jgi:hypothetical protein